MKASKEIRELRNQLTGIPTDFAQFTAEGGLAVRLINKTGAASVKGTMVSAGLAVDSSIILQTSGDEVEVCE